MSAARSAGAAGGRASACSLATMRCPSVASAPVACSPLLGGAGAALLGVSVASLAVAEALGFGSSVAAGSVGSSCAVASGWPVSDRSICPCVAGGWDSVAGALVSAAATGSASGYGAALSSAALVALSSGAGSDGCGCVWPAAGSVDSG